jgi:hypothetical protein
MFVVECAARTVSGASVAMPLLTELVSSENGFCYKHGAPNGAVPKRAPPVQPKTAKNPLLSAAALEVNKRADSNIRSWNHCFKAALQPPVPAALRQTLPGG